MGKYTNIFYGIKTELLDLDSWPSINENELSEEELIIYRARRDAMITLIRSGGDTRAAATVGGCGIREIARVFHRCIAVAKDGRIAGFRACKRYYHIEEYERVKSGPGTAGLLRMVFRRHPDIEAKLREMVLGSGRLDDFPPPGPSDLGAEFLELCRQKSFHPGEYPLNTSNSARVSLEEWRTKLLNTNGRAYAEMNFGRESANNFDDGTAAWEPPTDPHRILSFDEYTNDVCAAIPVPRGDGPSEWVPMARFKTFNGRRRGSGDVVVSRRVLRREPDTDKFLSAVDAAIRPHERRRFSIAGFEYPDGPCFASDIVEGAWLLPDLILLDNAKIHLAKDTREALTRSLGCIILFGVPRRPKSRPDIEAYNKSLATFLQKMPMTYGSGAKSPRRRDPEGSAVRLQFDEEQLAEILEMHAARFAHNPLKSLRGHTPMEDFSRWVTDDTILLRHLPRERREGFNLRVVRVRARISCNAESGRQPVVRHKYGDYFGPKLSQMRSHDKEVCQLEFNPELAHVARLLSADGTTEIDILHTRGEWSMPHRLSDREAYRKLLRSRKIQPAAFGRSPLQCLREHFESGARTNKYTALSYADFLSDRPAAASLEEKPKADITAPQNADQACQDEPESPNRLKSSGDW